MKRAFIFPGQGTQFSGMGKDLYDGFDEAKALFNLADNLLGFDLSATMFEGSTKDLKQTKFTQPAIFLHSLIKARCLKNFDPKGVAGHSLGEFSALTSVGVLSFESGLSLVYKRALAMQKACEKIPSTMAVIIGMEDHIVEKICRDTKATVVVANYNCPGQLVISGERDAVTSACQLAKKKGAKMSLPLPVGGAFHSPLMESAREELEEEIKKTSFDKPICPIYQNVNAKPSTDPEVIKKNLILQITGAVLWKQTIQNMIRDGYTSFKEIGPGKVLKGLVHKIDPSVEVD